MSSNQKLVVISNITIIPYPGFLTNRKMCTFHIINGFISIKSNQNPIQRLYIRYNNYMQSSVSAIVL